MSQFLVILSDDQSAGRGVRGMTLYWFLKTFHGRSAVQVATPAELLPRRKISADYVFIGLPTTVTRRQMAGLRFRQLVLFDYHDYPLPVWGQSDQAFLRSLTDHYWKPWVEHDWPSHFQWGCLPIRRNPKMKAYLRWQRMTGRGVSTGAKRFDSAKRFDIGFLGGPHGLRCGGEGSTDSYNQRVEWLLELNHELPQVTFWGGLTIPPHLRGWQQQHQDISTIEYSEERINFFRYFRSMCQSRVALAPAGNARWSYRQYEAIYARAAVVSTDFTRANMLIPFPTESVFMVPDRQPVTPYVCRALELQRNFPDKVEESVRFLERYLHDGSYSRRKPLPMDRLLQQLNSATSVATLDVA